MTRGSLFTIAMIVCLLFSFDIAQVLAAMTSTNYQINWDTVGLGGEDTASSATYKLRDSLGWVGTSASSATYKVMDGYRVGVYDRTVDFNVFSQSRNTQVGATSSTATTVTVSTTTGYDPNDYIVLVQDEGASQVTAVGRVTSATATVITVDAFSGGSPTIDGTNDVVYELTGSTINLGTIGSSAVSTAVIGWEATADVSQGYSVYIYENQDLLASGPSTITDVSDGAVTAGATEYGARSSDSSLALSTFDTADTALTSTLQQVASRSDNSYETRDYITLKASAASGYASGGYSHTVTAIFVGDY